MSRINPELGEKGQKSASRAATVFAGANGRKKQTPESAWRSTCIDWLKIRFRGQIWHLRTVAGLGQRFGVLDDIFVIRGVCVQCEFKRPDGKYRTDTKTYAAQVREIEAIKRAGGRAGFVESWEDLQALLAGIDPIQLGMEMR